MDKNESLDYIYQDLKFKIRLVMHERLFKYIPFALSGETLNAVAIISLKLNIEINTLLINPGIILHKLLISII